MDMTRVMSESGTRPRVVPYILSILMLAFLSQQIDGQTVGRECLSILLDVDLKEVRIDKALESLSGPAGVPIGFEFVEVEGDDLHVSLRSKQAKLSEILDSLVGQLPNYKWVYSNGIVEVSPKAKGASLLEQPIENFGLEGAFPSDIGIQILNLTSVANELKRSGYSFKPSYFDEEQVPSVSTLIGAGPKAVTIKTKASVVSLRTFLNGILTEKKAYYWVFRVEESKRRVSLLIVGN